MRTDSNANDNDNENGKLRASESLFTFAFLQWSNLLNGSFEVTLIL